MLVPRAEGQARTGGHPAQRPGKQRRGAPMGAFQARAHPWLLLLLFWALPGAGGARWAGEGTSPHLQSIFLGRCHDFLPKLSAEQRARNCTAMWEAFRVVLDKHPCQVLPSDYDRFMELARHDLPPDKSLFWENNHLLVMSYSEHARRLVPLCDVLYGLVGDLLSWCRQVNGTGLDYQSCPTAEDCTDNAVDSFWKRASIQYATDSSGVIYVMLNGSEPTGAYPVKGFFADYEIPYLQKEKVTRIEVWVMHDVGKRKVESCGEGSVKVLQQRLEGLGFQYSCIDDHVPVKLLMCVDHSKQPECLLNSAGRAAAGLARPLSTLHPARLMLPLLLPLAVAAGT